MKKSLFTFSVLQKAALVGGMLVFPWCLARAADAYFDVNGATLGSGVTASGSYTWDSNWSSSADGDVATGSWTGGDDAIFSAGTNSVGYTVTLSFGTFTVNSLTLKDSGSIALNHPGVSPYSIITLTSGEIDVASGGILTISPRLSGSNGLIKTGAGSVSFAGLAANYTGDTQVNAGTASFSSGRTSVNSRIVLAGTGIFRNYSGDNTVAGISGVSGDSIIENGAGGPSVLTISRATDDQSYAGKIRNGGAGTLGITKAGAYTQTLSGTLFHTGVTTVSAGTLLINGDASAATGAVSVASGATLGGTGTIGGATTLAAGGYLAAGDGGVGTLTFSDALDISAVNDDGNLKFELGAIAASDQIVSDSLAIGSGNLGFDDFSFSTVAGFGTGIYTLFSSSSLIGSLDASNLTGLIGGYDASLSISGNDVLLNVIPEANTSALLLLAGLGLLGRRKRERIFAR